MLENLQQYNIILPPYEITAGTGWFSIVDCTSLLSCLPSHPYLTALILFCLPTSCLTEVHNMSCSASFISHWVVQQIVPVVALTHPDTFLLPLLRDIVESLGYLVCPCPSIYHLADARIAKTQIATSANLAAQPNALLILPWERQWDGIYRSKSSSDHCASASDSQFGMQRGTNYPRDSSSVEHVPNHNIFWRFPFCWSQLKIFPLYC